MVGLAGCQGDLTEPGPRHHRPKGGEIQIQGELQRSGDRKTRTFMSQIRATQTHSACVYEIRGGLVTIQGTPNLQVEGTRMLVAGEQRGSQTMPHTDSFTWSKSTGEAGTCAVDIHSVMDPAARAHGDRHLLRP